MQRRSALSSSAFALSIFALALGACRKGPDEPANAVVETPDRQLPLPVAEAPVDRTQLLSLVMKAASAAALGQRDAEQQRLLDGKTFEVRLRFGCSAEAEEMKAEGPFKVSFDEKDRTLRISAVPSLTSEDPQVAQLAVAEVEAVEGFWLPRPWLLRAGCPKVQPPAQPEPVPGEEAAPSEESKAPAVPPPAPSQRIGIAQFFTASEPRTSRRKQRPYQVTAVLGENERPSAEGYDLVLSGRLRRGPGEKVIDCRSLSAERAPDCIVSAQFDRVWIERPDTGAVLAEWAS